LEQRIYFANGQLLAGNLADYLIPDNDRFSEDPGGLARKSQVTKQPARRQECRGGRDHPDRRV
jgi:predicted amidohydrolase YtcJ